MRISSSFFSQSDWYSSSGNSPDLYKTSIQYRDSPASFCAMFILETKSACDCPYCASVTLAPMLVAQRIHCRVISNSLLSSDSDSKYSKFSTFFL